MTFTHSEIRTSMRLSALSLALLCSDGAAGLHVNPTALRPARPSPALHPAQPADGRVGQAAALAAVAALAIVEPAAASDVAWIAPTKAVMGPALTLGTLAFLFRVVLSWFPKYDLKELPWSVVAAPTEPILKLTRALIPPVAGVDITPIVWVGVLSFVSEILLGPQGLFTIMEVCAVAIPRACAAACARQEASDAVMS